MRIIYILFLLIGCLFREEAWAQLSITSAGTTYAQDFNTLAQSGSTNPQSGGIFDAGLNVGCRNIPFTTPHVIQMIKNLAPILDQSGVIPNLY